MQLDVTSVTSLRNSDPFHEDEASSALVAECGGEWLEQRLERLLSPEAWHQLKERRTNLGGADGAYMTAAGFLWLVDIKASTDRALPGMHTHGIKVSAVENLEAFARLRRVSGGFLLWPDLHFATIADVQRHGVKQGTEWYAFNASNAKHVRDFFVQREVPTASTQPTSPLALVRAAPLLTEIDDPWAGADECDECAGFADRHASNCSRFHARCPYCGYQLQRDGVTGFFCFACALPIWPGDAVRAA